MSQGIVLICERIVSGGYLVMISAVCALQYLHHIHRTRKAAEVQARLNKEIDEIQNDLHDMTRERTLTSLENQILREFTGELEVDRTIEHLLRRLVGESKESFAAYVALEADAQQVLQARGLSDEARKNLAIDAAFIERVSREGVVTLSKRDLFGSRLLDSLSSGERMRINELILAGVGESTSLAGVILTTSLFPAGAPRDQQVELMRRLMASLSGIVLRSEAIADRDRRLQSIQEIMELRAVADRKHTSPLDMIEAFVDRLRTMLAAERAVLFLCTPGTGESYKALCRCGEALPPGTDKKYAEGEALLAECAMSRSHSFVLDASEVAALGATLAGGAVLAPIIGSSGVAGAICFTRRNREPIPQPRSGLMNWATRYLSDTLLKAMHQAVSEWHARQDALTGLSNRRTFDSELTQTFSSHSSSGDSFALLMLDVDRFKSINDNYGHPAGDEVIRYIGRVLKAAVARLGSNGTAVAARFGGEEFAVLLRGAGLDVALRLGETIRTAVEMKPVSTPKAEISATVSVGVAVFPEHARTASELIAAADSGLYQAKETGRNRVRTPAAATI